MEGLSAPAAALTTGADVVRGLIEAEDARLQMARFQNALGDYYDAGMIGVAPKLDDFTSARG